MNTQTQEALKIAIELLESPHITEQRINQVAQACKEALAQPAQEPVAWMDSPFEKWRLNCIPQVGFTAEIRELLALAFEGGRQSALESQEQDSLRWANAVIDAYKDGYIAGKNTAPSWQGLTAKEIASIPLNEYTVQTVERMLKEKNT